MISDSDKETGLTAPFPQPSTDNHARNILGDSLVYPVISRRSGGLSIGINLFPERKTCNFDCPYCEVFTGDDCPAGVSGKVAGTDPATGKHQGVSVISASLSRDLDDFFNRIYPESFASEPIRDLCISGDGEPTLSPDLKTCLDLLDTARSRYPSILAGVPTVIITNSTGFLKPGIAAMLSGFSVRGNLDIWAKIDAGTQEIFSLMSGSFFRFDELLSGILDFSREVPVIIQSMICRVGEFNPGIQDFESSAAALHTLATRGSRIREVHLYTLARPANHLGVRPVEDSILLEAAGIIAAALPSCITVKAFGPEGLIS